jgi:hypothetical protein
MIIAFSVTMPYRSTRVGYCWPTRAYETQLSTEKLDQSNTSYKPQHLWSNSGFLSLLFVYLKFELQCRMMAWLLSGFVVLGDFEHTPDAAATAATSSL